MEFHLLRPYWLLAILPILYLCWRLSQQSISDNWHKICDRHLLPHLLVEPKHRMNLPILLLAIGSLISIIALAGPSWTEQAQPVYRSSQGTVIVLNLTPSMLDKIGTSTKIDRARFKMLDYLSSQKNNLTGLVVYSDEAHVISPLTEDNHTIANFVPSLDPGIMPTFNDDTRTGLLAAGKLLQQGGVNQGNILLITDKVSNDGTAKSVAKSLYQQGYRLNILEISEDAGINKALKKLAVAGGGVAIPLSPNNQDVDKMIAQTKEKFWSFATKKTDEKGLFWHDDGRWLVFLLIPLAVLCFRRGYL